MGVPVTVPNPVVLNGSEASFVMNTLDACMRASVPKLVENIQKRGRDYEEAIRLDYLNRLNERYEAWISTYTQGKLLIIDVDTNRFHENKLDLGAVIEGVDAELHGLFV